MRYLIYKKCKNEFSEFSPYPNLKVLHVAFSDCDGCQGKPVVVIADARVLFWHRSGIDFKYWYDKYHDCLGGHNRSFEPMTIGMLERGLLNLMLGYATANSIEAETLSLSERKWRDQGGCIAWWNYVPFQSEYGPQLTSSPFDFGVGTAAIAAAAVAASIVNGILASPEIWLKFEQSKNNWTNEL